MRLDVLTLFPDLFQGYLTQSILKLAIDRGLVAIHLWNIRDWARGKHKSVDDRPFGGGPGMVIMPEPVYDCVEAVQSQAEPGLLIMLTPGGQRLTQEVVRELASYKRLVLLCGRYEGFDERIRLGLKPREISIGDFICNGGEVPAMVVIDTVVRYVPGVLGDEKSVDEESHSAPGQVEYPQYTRPRVFRGMEVPEILLSGNHPAIAAWRHEQSTARSRPTPFVPGGRGVGGEGADLTPLAPGGRGVGGEGAATNQSEPTNTGESHEESTDEAGGASRP